MNKNLYLMLGCLVGIGVITLITFAFIKLYKKIGKKVLIYVLLISAVIIATSIIIPKIQQISRDKEAEKQKEEWQLEYDKNTQFETDIAQRIASDLYDTELRSIASEFEVSVVAHNCIAETIYFESIGVYSLCSYSNERYHEFLALAESVSQEFTKFIRAKYYQAGDVDVYVFFMDNFIFLNGKLDTEKTAEYYDINREP